MGGFFVGKLKCETSHSGSLPTAVAVVIPFSAFCVAESPNAFDGRDLPLVAPFRGDLDPHLTDAVPSNRAFLVKYGCCTVALSLESISQTASRFVPPLLQGAPV